jgi:hypothetical protein
MRAAPGDFLRRITPLLAVATIACGTAGDEARRDDAAADTPAVGSAEARLDSATVTILDTLHGREVVSQCSRPSPGPVTSYWVPTPAQVAEADAAVLRALAAVEIEGARADTGVRRYHRQYAGLVRGGDRLLYVNGIAREAIAAQEDTAAWRTVGQVACDGGAAFFGAEYDPATRRVSALHFNGPG